MRVLVFPEIFKFILSLDIINWSEREQRWSVLNGLLQQRFGGLCTLP